MAYQIAPLLVILNDLKVLTSMLMLC